MDNQNKVNNHPYRLLIIIVFLIFAGILLFLVINKFRNDTSRFYGAVDKAKITPQGAPLVTTGALSISISGGGAKHPLTDYVILEIGADSPSIDVAGYDLLLNYDSQAFELIQAESLTSDFQVYQIKSPGKLVLTGAKKIAATKTNIWSGEKIVKLVFKPIKVGKYSFRIINQLNKEKTQFVDVQSKIYYPKTGQTEVEIY